MLRFYGWGERLWVGFLGFHSIIRAHLHFGPHPFSTSLATLLLGVDVEVAKREEEEVLLRDARQWLNAGKISDEPHPKTGATALHVAAAKGYIEVMR